MDSKNEYIFTRDFLDNTRINMMHHIWTKIFGYNIHPKISSEAANLRVADVGTGTGIWLFDVQDKLKKARLDGFDVSFNTAPLRETLPPNISFRHWDVKGDVPEDLVGAYDIINVRFFSYVLLDDDVLGVVAKLFRLLKPGGYLQWGEPDMETMRLDKTKPENKTENLVELLQLFTVQDDRLKPTWVRHLSEIFSKAGFVDIEQDTKDAPPHLAFMFHEAGLMIHDLFARKTKNEHMARELGRLLPVAVEENKHGVYGTALRVTVIGRKPRER
ncbi:S-adenosyl-L-methionine-dependent methyltransferase [Annulohypoxylon nitens]|nr:S-adenosyl-L-methionine-dependent methyltransferase [Annulohypoxylon nitens]